jgi:hypothetical protein
MRDCDRAATCQCKFKHFPDRRAGLRRTGDVLNDMRSQFLDNNRRATAGRRASDSR